MIIFVAMCRLELDWGGPAAVGNTAARYAVLWCAVLYWGQGDNQCGEGEGDCNTDQDCAGLLVCGRDNCGRAGGRRAALYRSPV